MGKNCHIFCETKRNRKLNRNEMDLCGAVVPDSSQPNRISHKIASHLMASHVLPTHLFAWTIPLNRNEATNIYLLFAFAIAFVFWTIFSGPFSPSTTAAHSSSTLLLFYFFSICFNLMNKVIILSDFSYFLSFAHPFCILFSPSRFAPKKKQRAEKVYWTFSIVFYWLVQFQMFRIFSHLKWKNLFSMFAVLSLLPLLPTCDAIFVNASLYTCWCDHDSEWTKYRNENSWLRAVR